MSALLAGSGSNGFRLWKPGFASWHPARALLRALHESRMRAAAKLCREFAHLNAANRTVAGQRPTLWPQRREAV